MLHSNQGPGYFSSGFEMQHIHKKALLGSLFPTFFDHSTKDFCDPTIFINFYSCSKK